VTSFVARRPLAFSVLVALMPLLAMAFLRDRLATMTLPDLANRLVVEALFCGYVILLLSLLSWWGEAGFARSMTHRTLVSYLPLFVLPLLVLAGSGVKTASVGRMIGFALFALMVGFAEEGLVRGIILRALLPAGAVRAVLLSSLIFGVGHFANIWQGASAMATIVQVTFSTFLGIGFAGARVYTGTIWPAIGLHWLLDLFDVAGRGFSATFVATCDACSSNGANRSH
jgi:membrane protease YdiL (CAAX protease family)